MRAALFAVVLLAAFAAAQLGPNSCTTPPSQSDSCTSYTNVAAATNEQCGVCYGGTRGSGGAAGNYNFYCSDAETYCTVASGGTYPTCQPQNIALRGEPCTGSGTFCSDSKWPISCLTSGTNNVCGSTGVFEAGAACATTTFNDFLTISNLNLVGCKASQCVGGQCNVTSTGCQPLLTAPGVTPAPPPPSSFCDTTKSPSEAVSRYGIGADCKNNSAGCVWNAACVVDARDSANIKKTCVKYGSATVGSSCTPGVPICTGDLTCVANGDGFPVCTTVVADGNSCSFGSSSQCDTAAQPTSSCVCDYTSGAGVCVGSNLGTAVVSAYADLADCIQANGCTATGSPYYGSCIANHCASEYKKSMCTTRPTKLKALKTGNTGVKSICGGGSGAASAALAVAAAFAAVLAMIMA